MENIYSDHKNTVSDDGNYYVGGDDLNDNSFAYMNLQWEFVFQECPEGQYEFPKNQKTKKGCNRSPNMKSNRSIRYDDQPENDQENISAKKHSIHFHSAYGIFIFHRSEVGAVCGTQSGIVFPLMQ